MREENSGSLRGPDETYPANWPVRRIRGEANDAPPAPDTTALCLSGGGYRAMLFHLGVLWRLNEAGILGRLDRISSVSGGSITAGVLAMNWDRLSFDNAGVAKELTSQVVEPVRAMARHTIDVTSILLALGLPFHSISDEVTRAYRKQLFGDTTLQDLPDSPRFVINATNVESGVLMRFSKAHLSDYRVGRIENPDLPLAVAVAASSAFPPFLSPCTLDLSGQRWITEPGNDLTGEGFRGEVRLTDGGVYDNLGLTTAWNCATIIASDAGGQLRAEADPATDWVRHTARVLLMSNDEITSIRKQQLIEALEAKERAGVYIGIRSDVASYPASAAYPVDPATTRRLAEIHTRLDGLDEPTQEQLINWGYTVTDVGLRSHVDTNLQPGQLPYPGRPLKD